MKRGNPLLKSLKSKSLAVNLNMSNNTSTNNLIVINNKITVNTTIKAPASLYKPKTTQEIKTKSDINQKLKDFTLTPSNSIKSGNKSSQNVNIITYNTIINSNTKVVIENNGNKRDAETQTEDIFFKK